MIRYRSHTGTAKHLIQSKLFYSCLGIMYN